MTTVGQRVLDDIFRRGMEGEPITEDTERDLICAARNGSEDAFVRLAYQYAPAMRAAMRPYQGLPRDRKESYQQTLLGALWGAIRECGTEGRLASYLAYRAPLAEALSQHAAQAFEAVRIPARTMWRYWEVIKAAGEQARPARDVAPECGMAATTFDRIRALQHASRGLDEVEVPHNAPTALAEDRRATQRALAALPDTEREVIELIYGLGGRESRTQAKVGALLGVSQSQVQRIHSRAIAIMREALCAA